MRRGIPGWAGVGLLALGLFVGIAGRAVAAQTDPDSQAVMLVELGAETISPTKRVWMALWGTDMAEVQAWEATVTYNDGILEPTGAVRWGGAEAGWFGAGEINLGPDYEPNCLTVGQIGFAEHTGNGRLIAIELLATKPGRSRFELESMLLFRADGTEHAVLASAGATLTVGCFGDFAEPWGFRDLADVMMMLPAWNTDEGEEGYDVRFDLWPINDLDGHIGLGDLMQVVVLWNTPCP